MGITIYLVAALVVLGAIAGAGYKGYGLGADHERVANLAAQEEARKEEAERQHWNQLTARKEAQGLETSLNQQRSLTRDLGTSLAKHIAALPPRPAGCPPDRLSDDLLNDANRALTGFTDTTGRGVPSPGGPAANPDRPNADGAAQPAGNSGR